MTKKMYKSRDDVKIDGVCAGFAKYFNFDPTLARIVWLIFALQGWGILFYILCALLMPREPKGSADTNDYNDYQGNEN